VARPARLRHASPHDRPRRRRPPCRPAPAPPPAVDGAVDASETAAPGAGAPSADTPDTDATGVDQHFLGRLAAAREAYALPPRLRAGTERAVRELLALLFPQLATEEAACGVREVADELAGVRRALRRVLAPSPRSPGAPPRRSRRPRSPSCPPCTTRCSRTRAPRTTATRRRRASTR
jgi:hypothetical protein